ncbi:hypothetical protein PIB30_037587 [Stylosanthes scabra]|uniref:Uncharacterized protein n=1 Tax=Stylosanthes scabra TaxID=79078 RepID=A0ABU6VFA2_9FABA|nr:hypothetical protein [Stylosanthes scabra]
MEVVVDVEGVEKRHEVRRESFEARGLVGKGGRRVVECGGADQYPYSPHIHATAQKYAPFRTGLVGTGQEGPNCHPWWQVFTKKATPCHGFGVVSKTKKKPWQGGKFLGKKPHPATDFVLLMQNERKPWQGATDLTQYLKKWNPATVHVHFVASK